MYLRGSIFQNFLLWKGCVPHPFLYSALWPKPFTPQPIFFSLREKSRAHRSPKVVIYDILQGKKGVIANLTSRGGREVISPLDSSFYSYSLCL